ncbi:MAG: DegT/DnrJ/EryC1/StrS family aminotransferase [Bacteroidetes bacterium]|nr:DegT/DnrJ/EryC1/StrS family aminotransferase [Bacteroidota bacterium]
MSIGLNRNGGDQQNLSVQAEILTKIRDFFQCKHLLPVGSGTSGLYTCLRAIGVRKKKVILPVLTCPNIVIAVYAAGGIPVVVDVSENDYNISLPSLKRAMDHDVKAVIAVDSFGYPAPIREIKKITAPYQCFVLEDACHAYGGKSGNEKIGTRGDAGVLSFGYSKPVDLLGGGFLLTQSDTLAQRLKQIISQWWFYQVKSKRNEIALNLMMESKYSLFSYLARYFFLLDYNWPLRQIQLLPEKWTMFINHLEKNLKNMSQVHGIISECRGINTFGYDPGVNWLPWRYSFKIPDGTNRMVFEKLAQENKIDFTRLYPPLDRHFKNLVINCDLDHARDLASTVYNLTYSLENDNTAILTEKLSVFSHQWNSMIAKT